MIKGVVVPIVALLALLAAMTGLYIGGGPIGYASGHDVFRSLLFPQPNPPSDWFGGPTFSIGLETVYLPAGWSLHADYKVTASYGALRLAVMELYRPIGQGYHVWQHIGGVAEGRYSVTVPHAAFYKFLYGGSVLGGPADRSGHDVHYEITWRIAPPR